MMEKKFCVSTQVVLFGLLFEKAAKHAVLTLTMYEVVGLRIFAALGKFEISSNISFRAGYTCISNWLGTFSKSSISGTDLAFLISISTLRF